VNRDFVQENAHSLARLKALIARLTPEQLAMPLDDGWTIGAVLAHLAFWDRRMLLLIERFQREGITDSPYDVHVMNDAMKPMLLVIPPNEAARICVEAAEQVDAAVAALSDEFIRAVKEHGTPFNPNRSEHRTYHLDEIEHALAAA
jgi:hypothetical protein